MKTLSIILFVGLVSFGASAETVTLECPGLEARLDPSLQFKLNQGDVDMQSRGKALGNAFQLLSQFATGDAGVSYHPVSRAPNVNGLDDSTAVYFVGGTRETTFENLWSGDPDGAFLMIQVLQTASAGTVYHAQVFTFDGALGF